MPLALHEPPDRVDVDAEEAGGLDELVESLGGIPRCRIRRHPPPGTATEADALAAQEAPRKRLCELVDGVLVEKPMGYEESLLAGVLIRLLGNHVGPKKLGWISVPDGLMRTTPGRARMPDVGFVPRSRFPGGKRPKGPVAAFAPDFAIEVLRASNTKREMRRKREEYFAAGTQVVWEIDPETRTAKVYRSAADDPPALTEADTLSAAPVLPDFSVVLGELFAELD